jgi:predicted MPP superfamily phosphohydrolase
MLGEGVHLDESAALAEAKPSEYTILLKHQPRVDEESAKRFNLQLSGHTHGGQLFPFHLLTRLIYQRYRGLYDLGGESSNGGSSPNGPFLYVNLGAGTWGPPIRLFAQPEVVVITLSGPG